MKKNRNQLNHSLCIMKFYFIKVIVFKMLKVLHSMFIMGSAEISDMLLLLRCFMFLGPCSLQALHKKLLTGETFQGGKTTKEFVDDTYWHGDGEIVHAVWTLVRMCASDDSSRIRGLVSDLISRVFLLDLLTPLLSDALCENLLDFSLLDCGCRLALMIHTLLFFISP